MKTTTTLTTLCAAMLLALTARPQETAAPDATQTPPRIELTLTDGSRLSGVPALETVPLTTSFAELNLPLLQVRTFEFVADREQVQMVMQNDNKLTGYTKLKEIKLTALFGEVVIGIQFVKSFRVFPGGTKIAEGLLLWNRLDSVDTIQNSVVGPAGTYNAGRFVEGRFGKAIELNMRESLGVTFPTTIIPGPAGCIEFWAKLTGFPNSMPSGNSPALVVCLDANNGFSLILNFNGNDGRGNGGLCPKVAHRFAGTGSFGSWSYAQALKADASDGWHHYAISWSNEGVKGLSSNAQRVAAYVDGKLNTMSWDSVSSNQYTPPETGRFGLLLHHNETAPGTVTFDNIKIWNYAKTDFSDRDEE